jgi:hypothetical protein
MKKNLSIVNNKKIKRFDFFTEQFINISLDELEWYSRLNEEEVIKRGKTDEENRLIRMANNENSKAFYGGVLACARFLQTYIDEGWNNELDEQGFKDEINFDFKINFAKEACSSKEINKYIFICCPPSYTFDTVIKIVDGEEVVTTANHRVSDGEPEVIVDEYGDLTFK